VLSSNQLRGGVPALPHTLITLQLHENQFTGPLDLRALTSLTRLYEHFSVFFLVDNCSCVFNNNYFFRDLRENQFDGRLSLPASVVHL
jgi:hypothetical protein